MPSTPRIDILMGVYNGEVHLPAQLASIASQNHRNWHLICSDDGSSDNSLRVIDGFSQQNPGRLTLRTGPGEGFAANFLSMLAGLPDSNQFVGFADQDDVWHAAKITRAIACLASHRDQPALYCGRRTIWWPGSERRIESPMRIRPCNFRNALIENVASGNTIVLNPKAARLAKEAAEQIEGAFAHDWFLYLLITGAGGKVFFDNGPPLILYRQHGGNAIGASGGLQAQLNRKFGVLHGRFKHRIDQNLHALKTLRHILTEENDQLLSEFSSARNQSLTWRLVAFSRCGVFRHDRSGAVGFWGAAALGKV